MVVASSTGSLPLYTQLVTFELSLAKLYSGEPGQIDHMSNVEKRNNLIANGWTKLK